MTISQALQIALQHHQAGRLKEAEALYCQILAAQPNHADAMHMLGVVAQQVGRLDLAADRIRQAIALHPNHPAAYSNLGETYRLMGRLDDAIAAFHRALELKPDYPQIHNNLGNAFRDRSLLDEAVVAYRRALELKPDYWEAHNNLGVALEDQGRLDDAIASYRRALKLKEDSPETHNRLGIALRKQGQLGDAIAAFHRALEIRANFPEAHNSLGAALSDRNQIEEAIDSFRRAIQLNPGYSEAHYNLGTALMQRGQLDEAVTAFRSALALKTDYFEAFNNLGIALKDRAELDEAIAAFRDALRLKPALANVHSNLICTLHFHPGHEAKTISEERQRWNRQFSSPIQRSILPHTNDRSTRRRLRIGYVSPFFQDHVVGRNLAPLFRRHDRESFEILCYSDTVRPDDLTGEFRRQSQQWRNTVGVNDQDLAERIRRDEVDILVDLTQHLAGNRLPLFALKPAPVQVSFAGYPESTGVEAIEYRISDRYLEGPASGAGAGSNEQVCLIDSFWCYDPCGIEVKINGLPAKEDGKVTFGCLNNFCKVNEPLLKLWARVLRQVASSRLVILSNMGIHRRRTLEALEREGVETHRVELAEPRPRRGYLELYHCLDIALDTFPYNGHTTSLDALWMGVPVVSLAGETRVSRAGLSQLTNLGLPELVAHSEEDYVRIAAELACDLPRLAELRATLRNRIENSVLMDAPRFARDIETAYRSMWERWCAEQSPLPNDSAS